MTKSEPIWSRAKAALTLTGVRGEEDIFLWEHSARVARTAQTVAGHPEIAPAVTDPVALLVASLYHDAAWVVRCRNGECARADLFIRPLSLEQRESALDVMEQSLAGVVPPPILERAARIIREFPDRDTSLSEARVLADAETLEDVSLASLWVAVRRGVLEGKGVQAVLDQWNRRREYHFWDARLKEGFHFPAVRAIAQRRLALYQDVMRHLEVQQNGLDLTLGAAASDSRNDRLHSSLGTG